MSSTLYLATWILAALAAAAGLCLLLARHAQRRELRRQQARRLVQSLQRYSDWVSAQRLVALFHGEAPAAAAALEEACTLRGTWFPELAGDMAELLAVHNRLLRFLGQQQSLWLRDPEHWLESEHDRRFMALWRQHRSALQALCNKLEQATPARIAPASRQSTYA